MGTEKDTVGVLLEEEGEVLAPLRTPFGDLRAATIDPIIVPGAGSEGRATRLPGGRRVWCAGAHPLRQAGPLGAAHRLDDAQARDDILGLDLALDPLAARGPVEEL